MLTAASQGFGMLIVMRALLGFGQAITEPSSASLLSDYYPTSRRGRVFSNQQVMVFIGFGLGIALGARSARSSDGGPPSSASAPRASSSRASRTR